MPDSLRSARWFGGRNLAGFVHRASLAAATADGRPVVGICNPWSELVHCNLHFRGLAEAVRRGVAGAGGIPLEVSTVALGENLMKPTTMLSRASTSSPHESTTSTRRPTACSYCETPVRR